jgi:plasmid maintenance system antidote protein VapI
MPDYRPRTPERRRAHAEYENRRRRLIAYGRWNPRTDAGHVRDHVRSLMAAGVSWRKIAALADVPEATIARLLWGRAGRPPSGWIRTPTATAILNVRADRESLSPRALVDATGTHRRLQALITLGWSRTKLAEHLELDRNTVGRILNRRRVYAATAVEVRDLYDRLWNVLPPRATKWDVSAAVAAQREATARGWVGPLAWDDENIDDPAARPAKARKAAKAIDDVVVERALAGRPVELNRAEAAEVTRIATARGMSASQIAEITDRAERSVVRYRSEMAT